MKTIDDFTVGQTSEMKRRFSQDEVDQFATISGDYNPIHLNAEYAQKTRFGKRIVHGFLTASLISAVLGNNLPGEGSVYLNQTLSFRRPVFVGDEITAKVVITDINKETKRISLNTVCMNQNGKIVIEGSALMYYPF